jgi:dedicated sortase system histidine kinase
VRFSLRRKLLVVSLSLLVLPWAGYRYISEMEGFLRHAQEQSLLTRARAGAVVLNSRVDLFARHAEHIGNVPDEHIYFVRTLNTPLQFDGYAEEWQPWLDLARVFDAGPGFRVRHLLGHRGDDLYALFVVEDEHLRYRDPRRRLDGDHLILRLGQHNYLLSTVAPGRVNAYVLEPDGTLGRWEPGIQAEFQDGAGGYSIELRIPLARTGGGIGFTLVDVDTYGEVAGVVHTAGATGHGVLLLPEPALEGLLAGLVGDDSRAWVVDTAGRVLAVAGRLAPGEDDEEVVHITLTDLLFGLFVPTPAYEFSDALARASQLDGPEVRTALGGAPDSRRRATADDRAVIVSAAYPIELDGKVMGAVVVEQTTNAILSVQNRALQSLAGGTLLVLGLAVAVLLLFATRLSLRIRRLRDQTEAAIGPDGRVHGGVGGSTAGDEIGDLSRSFADLLRRLGQYNRYLETMAGRLAHELRTPVVVVKSSLENLEHAGTDEARATYVQRARDGIDRLGMLLQRLSEATRLEQALQDTEPELFDLGELVQAVAEGYRAAYAPTPFDVQFDTGLPLRAAPELIAQMLDKLVSNAVDFATPGTAVCITAQRRGEQVQLAISNQGPPLPEEMGDRLFESMVSVRAHKGDTPHLGLGLHIVRLVVEFHGGQVAAANLSGQAGVMFTVSLPLAP